MRRVNLFLLLMLVLILPTSIATAKQSIFPSLEISNVYYPDPFLYVYVNANGQCQLSYAGLGIFQYKDTSGLMTIELYHDSPDACNTTPFQTFNVQYTVGDFWTLFIYAGTDGNPAYALFKNDLTNVPSGKARLFLRNGYSDPSADFVIQHKGNTPPVVVTVANGQQKVVDLQSGNWDITLNGVSEPVQFFSWNVPYHAGDFWSVTIGGLTPAEQVIGIWDYRYGG